MVSPMLLLLLLLQVAETSIKNGSSVGHLPGSVGSYLPIIFSTQACTLLTFEAAYLSGLELILALCVAYIL